MRRKVPFVGEEKIERLEDAENQAKKARGRVIDDVLSTENQATSWDDLVKPPADPKAPKANASVPKPAKQGTIPIAAGPYHNPIASNNPLAAMLLPPKKGMAMSRNGEATIDWVPINNGHGLRINVSGMLDQNLRDEWRALLEETANSNVHQFEFNMTQAPALSLTGLGMLLLFKENKGSERNDIKLCHCNKDVWQLLQWTGMDRYFTIQGSPNQEK